ncbi:MAG: hypothetical protein SVU32_01715, partial [Candidatus Nanohaloarchaea archaeon]|nr:hypothetical protein [Candidatus Nanohaloarchaea archaeon]
KSEYHDKEDIANYLRGEVEGLHRELNNDEWEEKESITLLGVSEAGLSTKFSSDDAWDGLAYKLQEKVEEGELDPSDNFGAVLNGGVLPRISKWNYKTARQAYRALDEFEGKDPNVTANTVKDQDALEELIEDHNLPDDEDLRQQYLDDVQEKMEELVKGNEYKITNLQEATEVAEQKIGQLYDAAGEDFDLFVHMGEQDEANIEDLEELKIQELTDEQEERMEMLTEKIQARNDTLQSLKREIEEVYGDEYHEIAQEIEEHVAEEKDPRELDLEDYDIDQDDLDVYQEALDMQEDLLKDIREIELNRNAMLVEQAFGEYANVFNRTHLEADQAELMRKLAELEYEEYYHQIGNVEEIASESELLDLELGGFDIDVAHKLHYTDTPLKTGFKKEKERYKDRTDGEADLFLTGHHGPFKAQQFVHGRGEDENDHTWIVQMSTFMDEEMLEEYGSDEGLHQLKDVKRLEKGLFDSTVSLLELKVEEGPDGELRKRFAIEGWDGEYLKKLGEQLNGDAEPGTDFADTDERRHIVARGDDQIGAQHEMEYLYEPLTEEVIEEDFHNIEEWIDGVEDDTTIIEVGDAFQGTDIYEGQQAEGSMFLGVEDLELKGAILSVFEDDDVRFESEQEFYEYLEENDLDTTTQQALDYAEKRNRAQVPIANMGQQGERVEELLVDSYEELLDRGADIILVDGNHYNDNQESLSESKRLETMFDDVFDDAIQTADGNSDGDGTFYLENEEGDQLQVRAKHRPQGYGSETVDKILDQALEKDTDVFVAGHLHVPSFGKQQDVLAMMPGSAQATNDFVKGFKDAPAEKGAVYLEVPADPEKKEFRFEHVSVKGINPLSAEE